MSITRALNWTNHHAKLVVGVSTLTIAVTIALFTLAHFGMLQKAWSATANFFTQKAGPWLHEFTKPWQVKAALAGGTALLILGSAGGVIAYKMRVKKDYEYMRLTFNRETQDYWGAENLSDSEEW